MKRTQVFGLAAVCALLLLANSAFAQRTTANIYGLIKDSSGAVIPGATVLLTNEETGIERTTISNEVGEFSSTFLPVGRYTLKVEAKGFKTFARKGLDLTSGQQSRLPITLEVGVATQEVQVTAEAPLLQNASAQLSDGMNRTQIDYLPQVNRDFTKLLDLQTGVAQGISGSGLLSINGLATAGITVTVDGVDSAGNAETSILNMFGGSNRINVISQEAIQEFSVTKGAISADVGRAFSGNVNVISKGGTNKFHGSLFEYLRNDIFNARNALLAPTSKKPVVRFNQFGGSLGGPMIKDKAFFFFTYEGYRESNFRIVGPSLVPTPEFKAQAIAAVPAYQKVLDLFPRPTVSYATGAASALYQGTASATARDNHIVVRGDYNLSSAHHLSGRYTRGRPYALNPVIIAVSPQTFTYTADSANLSWVFSASNWTSETRGGFNNTNTERINQSFKLGIPAITVQGHFSHSAEIMRLIGHTYSLEQIFARASGRHTLKFGGSYIVQAPGRTSEEMPIFQYANTAAFLANNPSSRVTFTLGQPLFHGRLWQLAGFVQDDFKVLPNLVLNLGVRYEFYSVFKNEEDSLYNPGTPANAYAIPPKFRPSDSFYNADYNNFMPRVGFAWSPGQDGRTAVRGGFGMSVGPLDLRNFYTFVSYAPGINWRYRLAGAQVTDLKLKYPMTNAEALQLIKTANVPASFEIWDENIPNSNALQWSLDIQRQLTPTLVVQAGYVGSKGYNIPLVHDLNNPDRLTGRPPYPHLALQYYKDAADMSIYHALQTSLRKRLSHDFLFNISYTWSKALAISQGDYYGGNDPEIQDENNPEADYGPMLLDRTQVFATSFGYTLPLDRWLNASQVLKQIMGGWQLGGIYRAATGVPLSVVQSSGLAASRPDFIGSEPYAHTGDRYAYLNASAFARVPLSPASLPIRPGNVGKGSLRGPGYWDLDLSLSKSFQVREGMNLGFRMDMFNAFNHVKLTNPTVDVTSSLFGRITAVQEARTMQMSLRLTF